MKKFWILVALIAIGVTGCSDDDSDMMESRVDEFRECCLVTQVCVRYNYVNERREMICPCPEPGREPDLCPPMAVPVHRDDEGVDDER